MAVANEPPIDVTKHGRVKPMIGRIKPHFDWQAGRVKEAVSFVRLVRRNNLISGAVANEDI